MKLMTTRAVLSSVYASQVPVEEEIIKLKEKLLAILRTINSLESSIPSGDNVVTRFMSTNVKVTKLGDVATELPEDTVLLQFAYWIFDIVCWAITRSGMVSLQSRKESAVLSKLSHQL
jgi:hypothetical protein